MRIFYVISILSLALLLSCKDTDEKKTSVDVAEPKNSSCDFTNPDTSVLELKIRDFASGKAFIQNDKPGYREEYRYYSKAYQQVLTLMQHPGDAKFEISIFRIEYSKKDDYGYRQINVDAFTTEKGIKIGMTKDEIIQR